MVAQKIYWKKKKWLELWELKMIIRRIDRKELELKLKSFIERFEMKNNEMI